MKRISLNGRTDTIKLARSCCEFWHIARNWRISRYLDNVQALLTFQFFIATTLPYYKSYLRFKLFFCYIRLQNWKTTGAINQAN